MFAMLEEATMQKVSLEFCPRNHFGTEERPSQPRALSCRQFLGAVKTSITKADQIKVVKKQTRRDCLPEQPQHVEEMIPSEIHMV